ncbi:FCD domain-containing protein [Streptomyces sp. SL13]|uniref:FCD domain-containing protein n=1 Tax=Streptantibioticus silvisoli TaxID=2705255 RepID=A0AA90GYJ5_9ACTN|nr:FCD domain-containing protein [Streptantibioticus silvisoli]MDI5961696.1 FCD domain-containing protein [Streptantibioticus silvisoli]MDI5968796.1 FCD domain-containing protein [Streptantibioticus silvisoli]
MRGVNGMVIVRTSLAEQATAWLREKITGGEWQVGERIPAEAELVVLTGLGRNTVREAVKALTYAGLLETRHGEGTFVHSANEVEATLRRRAGWAAARHVHEVRRGLEAEAARLAASRRTPADLDRLRETFAARATAGRHDPTAFVDADLRFHQAVADAAHNPVLAEIYASLTGQVACSVRATLHDPASVERSDVWHAALLRAVEDGDPDAAAAAAFDNLSDNLRVLGEDDDR